MGRIQFRFKDLSSQGEAVGYVGHHGVYGFVIHHSDIDGKYRVLWNVGGLRPLSSHDKNPFNSIEEAGSACEELLEQLLNKN